MANVRGQKASLNNNIFEGTHSIRDLTKYMLMRGVTDFGDLEQYNLFESGYSFLVVMGIPQFMKLMADKNDQYKTIIKTYTHILEFEFRGLSGLENMTADTGQLTNGIDSINIINRVKKQSDGSFSATYQEKLGSTITKAHELFLSGVKDPRTQVKTYHGLIEDGTLQAGYENEIFKFMYIVTDNTLLNLEKAVYLASCQPTSVPFDIYVSEKGTYEFKDISVEFNGYPIMSRDANKVANRFMGTIYNNTTWREADFSYSGLDDSAKMYSAQNSTGDARTASTGGSGANGSWVDATIGG